MSKKIVNKLLENGMIVVFDIARNSDYMTVHVSSFFDLKGE